VVQSSESFREHGPHAVRPPGAVFEAPPPVDLSTLDTLPPPPSSNGPTALRGSALADALARLGATI
jgi:hypothetical protein